jgi:hypothetical protein
MQYSAGMAQSSSFFKQWRSIFGFYPGELIYPGEITTFVKEDFARVEYILGLD